MSADPLLAQPVIVPTKLNGPDLSLGYKPWPPPDTPEVREEIARKLDQQSREQETEMGRVMLAAHAQMVRDGAPFLTMEQELEEMDALKGYDR